MPELIKPSKYDWIIDGRELLRRRDQRGWTQDKLASELSKYMNVSQQLVSRFESPGRRGDWQHKISLDLAKVFEVVLNESYPLS